MAFYVDPNKEQDELNQNSPTTSAESSLISPEANASVNSIGGPQTPNRGSRFVGINEYLRANQPKTEQLGKQVTGTIANYGNQAQTGISQTREHQGKDIQGQQVNYNPGLAQEALSNPASFVQDQGKKQAFLNMRDASYKGPSSFETSAAYQPLSKSVNEAVSKAKTSATQEGQAGLIADTQKSLIGNKAVGQRGAVALDNALISSDPGSRERIRAASANIQNTLPGALSSLSSEQNELINKVRAANQATSAQTRGLFQGASNPQGVLQKQLASRAQEQAGKSAQVDLIRNSLLSGQPLSSEQLTSAGLSPIDYGILTELTTKGKNLDTYLPYSGVGQGEFTANTVATPEEVARQNALSQLSGNDSFMLKENTQPLGLSSLSYNRDKAIADLIAGLPAKASTPKTAPVVAAPVSSGTAPDRAFIKGSPEKFAKSITSPVVGPLVKATKRLGGTINKTVRSVFG